MIKPTVGRVVWFYLWVQGQGHKGPLTAHVCKVHDDTCVNLMVIGENGETFPRLRVDLRQETVEYIETKALAIPHDYACWMPYQVGQAAKHENLTKVHEAVKEGFNS